MDDMASDDRDRRYREDAALQREVFSLRGEFLSVINEAESLLNYSVAAYFGHHEDQAFIRGILAPMSTRQKLDLVERILHQEGVESQFETLLRGMRQANDFRNSLAHSHVVLDLPTPGEMSDPAARSASRVASVRLTRSGLTHVRTDMADLRSRVNAVTELRNEAFRLWVITNAASGAPERTLISSLQQYEDLLGRE
jgi:hypothetical protein